MAQILYKDSTVTIYKDFIVINKYYFPLATSKTIKVLDIQRLGMFDSAGAQHRWGVCTMYMNNWFPLDNSRKNKPKFIELTLKFSTSKPCFSPDDPQKAFRVMWDNFTPQGREFQQEESKMVETFTQKPDQALVQKHLQEKSTNQLNSQTEKQILEKLPEKKDKEQEEKEKEKIGEENIPREVQICQIE